MKYLFLRHYLYIYYVCTIKSTIKNYSSHKKGDVSDNDPIRESIKAVSNIHGASEYGRLQKQEAGVNVIPSTQ